MCSLGAHKCLLDRLLPGLIVCSYNLESNVGIIVVSIPTLKPLLRSATGASNGNHHDQSNDVERPKTIGSDKLSRPHRSIFTTIGTRTDKETFEMIKTHAGSTQSRKIEVYTVIEEHAGSEDRILGSEFHDATRIKRTTEVVIDSVERDPQP